MRHQITSVEPRSVAYRHGICAGDFLLSLNGEPVIDEIDYQALIAGSRVTAVLERDGAEVTIDQLGENDKFDGYAHEAAYAAAAGKIYKD